ncbi:MAG: histidine phosphatase family protein [Candidatus Gracilibacteria bacterium]|nr:histidine phosphatase family protein [Candidatus Gracilibacteria bacterium]
MTKVIFVRHGRTDYNEAGKFDCIGVAQLTQQGKDQAQKLVDIFKDEDIAAIYSSPLQRCVNTITPLAESKGLPIDSKQAFLEIKSIELQDNLFSCKNFKYENNYGNGEKIIEVEARVHKELKKLLQDHVGKTIVICAHGDTTFLGRNYFHNFDYDTEKYECGLFLENNPEKYDIHSLYGIEICD